MSLSNLSDEDKKQILDMQDALQNARREHYQTLTRQDMKEKFKRKNELTLTEVEALPEDTNTYKAVGTYQFLFCVCS